MMTISTHGGIVPNAYLISSENTIYERPASTGLPSRRDQGRRVQYMISIICLSAAIFLLLRGHQCLTLLVSHGRLAGGIQGRLLALAETGSFRRCVGVGVEQALASRGVAGGGARSKVLHRSSSATSGDTVNDSSSGSSGSAPSGAAFVDADALAPTDAPEGVHDSPTLDGHEQRTPSQTAPFSDISRNVQRLRQLGTIAAGFFTNHGPRESHGAGGRDESFAGDRGIARTPHEISSSAFSVKNILLNLPADSAEHERLLSLLQPEDDGSLEFTNYDLDLMHTAEAYVNNLLKERSKILRGLHENAAQQALLRSRMEDQHELFPSPSVLQELLQLQGRLSKLEDQCRTLESRLRRVRSELKSLVPQSEHLSLSLRLTVRRRASGSPISPRGAAAISAALLIVKGRGGANCIVTPDEEEVIKGMVGEFLTRMRTLTAALTESVETAQARLGAGSTLSRSLVQRIRRGHRKCKYLQKDASLFLQQVKRVLMKDPPNQQIKELEVAELRLRQVIERSTSLLQNVQPLNAFNLFRSFFGHFFRRSVRAIRGAVSADNDSTDSD